MSIRTILVPVFGVDIDARSLEAAFGVADRFGAHVTGLFVRVGRAMRSRSSARVFRRR